MKGMWRTLLVVLVLSCGGTRVPPSPPPPFGGFRSQASREAACLDLRDHVVDLYVEDYVQANQERVLWDPADKRAFRDGWAGELAKSGAFDRFEASCFGSLQQDRWGCAMAVQNVDAVTACMRFGRASAP